MFLKKIEVQGFKSFADKINVELEKGITAVVGPNGSGKSNVSDAVRWVLGEQSAKTLRGSKMEDVIFSGTEQRKQLSFAEVSLILDNSDNSLPVEYSEVNITRRIFRSGESEYYINKVPCRLKDINELFMDTGIGRDGYSIVGQGRIDEILSSKSEDRRNVFEEAAGIMKYKTRKNESERKLENTRQNLLRINDIVNELELQIEPLREQSEKAKKYLELAEQLRTLNINLFIENYNKTKEKLESLNNQFNELDLTFKEYNSKLNYADEQSNSLAEKNKELETEIASINQQLFECEKYIEKIHSDINIANEKISNSNANKERIIKDNTLIEEKVLSFKSEIDTRNEKIIDIESSISSVNSLITEKEQELATMDKLLSQSMNEIEDLKSDVIEKHNEISNKKGTINSINVLIDNINNRKGQIETEYKDLEAEKNTKAAAQISLEKNQADLSEAISNGNKLISKLSDERASIETKLKNNSIELDKTKQLIANKSSRHSLLCDMDKEYEGFNKSVKSILQACEKSTSLGCGVHGALVQLISVPKAYEVAMDVALGGALQNIVTDDEESAEKIINYLKSNNLGRATFLPISSVKGRGFDGLEKELPSLKGYVGVASELITTDKKYSGIIGNLLGKVLVVDNIKSGVEIARKYKYAFKIVTLDGEVLNPGGSIAGGSVNKTTNLLSRAREIDELANEIKELKNTFENLTKNNDKFINEINNTSIQIEKQNNEQNNYNIKFAANQAELRQYKEQLEKIDDRIKTLALETSQLEEQYSKASEEIIQLGHNISLLEKEIHQITEKTAINQDKYKKDIELREKILSSLTEERIKVSSLNQDLIFAKENILRIEKDIEDISSETEKNNEILKSIDAEIVSQNEVISLKVLELEEYKKKSDDFNHLFASKTGQKTSMESELENLQKSWKQYNALLSSISEEKNKVEVKVAKLEMELETLQNNIWDEYELTYAKCLEFKKDISSYGNPNKAISEIKSQIHALGTINVGAIEEYVKVKERYEFLTTQKNDLEDAEKSLRKIINDMIHIMKKQFIEQFEIINSNFNEVFKELFGGGRAHLKLTDPENVLECGIDIEAQPPGKKLQNLMLLSGGERALTAIAILFAMLKVRPTPFCIFDEIEAALDDINVFRYANYVKKFSDNTQFLVITHRRGTMEVADALYGVTMQEHGVSKLVSVKLSEQAS